MLGAAIIVFVLLIGIPVGILVSGGIGAAVIGWAVRTDADERNAGSELIDLNG